MKLVYLAEFPVYRFGRLRRWEQVRDLRWAYESLAHATRDARMYCDLDGQKTTTVSLTGGYGDFAEMHTTSASDDTRRQFRIIGIPVLKPETKS